MGAKHMTPDVMDKIVDLFTQGFRKEYICVQTDLSLPSVNRVLKARKDALECNLRKEDYIYHNVNIYMLAEKFVPAPEPEPAPVKEPADNTAVYLLKLLEKLDAVNAELSAIKEVILFKKGVDV